MNSITGILQKSAAIVLVLFCLCAGVRASECSPPDFLPSSGEIEGWKRDGRPSTYGPANLWEFINGAAEHFLTYDFSCVTAQPYVSGEDESLNLEIYRHSSPLMAFGIFSQFRTPDSQQYSIGNDSFGDSYSLHMWKGSYYVKVMVYSEGSGPEEAMKKFARRIAGGITEAGKLPPELDCFPGDGMVERSINFINQGVLGSTEFPPALVADYKKENAEGRLYIFPSHEDMDYNDVFNWYRERLGVEAEEVDSGGEIFLAAEGDDRYRGRILIFSYRNRMGVVTGFEDESGIRMNLAKKTVEQLAGIGKED